MILHGHEPHVRPLCRCRRPGDIVGASSGDIFCCDNGFNGTSGEQLRIDDGESVIWRCRYGSGPRIAYPDGDQSGRTRGRDIQAGLRRDGYLVPLSVLNYAAVFDLDCRECDLIWSGHGRGYDMPVAAYSREGGVQCFAGIRPQRQKIMDRSDHAVCVAFVIRRQR